jgi:RNA-directed DNA polymerase
MGSTSKAFLTGFRPGRGPHQALDALTVGIQQKRVNWVLDADIRGFFENMNHELTMKFVRYADDLVVGFQHRTDAEQFLRAFRERLAKFGLELNADKTRLIEFERFAARDRKRCGEGKPETFTFLGFTHFCGRLTNGAFIVWRITAKKRMVAKLKAIKAELQRRKHHRTTAVGAWLRKVVQGYYQYHAVPGNSTQLRIFSRRVCWVWRSVLVRRSQRAQVRWDRLSPLLLRWIPQPRILHPYPDARFAATHPG